MGIAITKASTATVSFSTPQEIVISHLDDSIRLGDGSNLVGTRSVNSIVGLATSDVNYAPMTYLIDEVSTSEIYMGWASAGASESSSVWRIKKISTTGTMTREQWAAGNVNFTNNWANRASLSYS